jgi:hypothetical protein
MTFSRYGKLYQNAYPRYYHWQRALENLLYRSGLRTTHFEKLARCEFAARVLPASPRVKGYVIQVV